MTSREKKERAKYKERLRRAKAPDHEKPSRHGVEKVADMEEVGFVLYARESTEKQDVGKQAAGAKIVLKETNKKAVKVFMETVTGKTLNPSIRTQLHATIKFAKKRNVPLVAACFSRFLRNKRFRTAHDGTQPTKREIEAFMKLTKGINVATLNDPDATCGDDEEYLRMLNEKAKGIKRKGKYPGYVKERRNGFMEEARVRRTRGESLRKIASSISKKSGHPISHMTIDRWTIGCHPKCNKKVRRSP